MKDIKKIVLGTLILYGAQFGLVGCVADVGGGYYDRGPWYHDGPWMDGSPRGAVDIDIHPPGFRR